MSEGQDGYGKFFKQARQASGLSSDSGSLKENSRRQFSVKPERESSRGSSRDPARSPARGPSRGGESFSTRDSDIEEIIRRSTPEENLRSELGRKIQARSQVARKKKNSFPVGATLILVLIIFGAGMGYYRPEIYESLASRVDIGFFGQAHAADETMDAKSKHAKKADHKSDQKSDKKAISKSAGDRDEKSATAPPGEAEKVAANDTTSGENSPASGDDKKDEKVTNIHGWTPEELSFFNKLNERKKELDLREAELTKLEAELQKQKLALDDKIKQLDHTRDEISSTLKTRVATDQAKVDKLVEFYSTMKPQQAAKVIESLNEELAVSVLDKMKKKNAAEVLNVMDAKKARRFSELLTGYERSPASGDSGDASADSAAK